MKTCDLYGQKIEAYTPTELESLKHHGAIAQNIWFQAWKTQGGDDSGTYTGGKALQVWYIGKGKRKPVRLGARQYIRPAIKRFRNPIPRG